MPTDLVAVGGLEGLDEIIEEVEDLGGRLVTELRQAWSEVVIAHDGSPLRLRAGFRGSGRFRFGKHIEVEFLVEHRSFALDGCTQELSGHGGEDAVVAGGVIAEGLAKLRGHEAGVAGAGEQVIEAGGEFFAASVFHQEPGTDPAAQWKKILAPELVGKPAVTGEHDAEQRFGIETRAGKQAQFAQRARIHLLCLVNEQYRA